jgi:serine phosphatase RsbU (regulator of sigma subunit)
MNILVAWDNSQEADLIQLYLTSADNGVMVALSSEEFLGQLRQGPWDAVLMALTFPKTVDEGFALFSQVRKTLPDVPVVVGCRPTEMIDLARFLTHGLRHYIIRDGQGDFIFLMLSSLKSAVEAHHAEQASRLAERLREELDSVRRLQESIIPHGLPPPPGYRIVARYEPSQVTVLGDRPVVLAGGDYYDLFRPDDHTLIALISDASGHGLKACMSIMTMHTLIRMFAGQAYRDTAAFVAEINRQLCDNSIVQSGEGFITLFYAAIDTVDHRMTWTSAGHPAALLHLLSEDRVRTIGNGADGGLPLGISPHAEYSSAQVFLPPASRMLLYSDGLTDAFPLDGNARNSFGLRGITQGLQACRQMDLEQTLDHLFQASTTFTGNNGRHDDSSALLLERATTGGTNGYHG